MGQATDIICFSIRVFNSGSAREWDFNQWLILSGMIGLSLVAIFSMFMVKMVSQGKVSRTKSNKFFKETTDLHLDKFYSETTIRPKLEYCMNNTSLIGECNK